MAIRGGQTAPLPSMFDDYSDIFNQRGASYHAAMRMVPAARREEFASALALLDLRDGLRLIDAPAGGGYLRDHLHHQLIVHQVETSATFAEHAAEAGRGPVILCDRLDRIPLADGSADRVLSLAGVHHLDKQPAFYQEACRLLVPNGIFCLADVAAGSTVDRFLNQFVHQHCSTGHQGHFLGDATANELEQAGFRVVHDQHTHFDWHFRDRQEMTTWCALLFGLDRSDHQTILDGIHSTTGFSEDHHGCHLHWNLRQFKAVKS